MTIRDICCKTEKPLSFQMVQYTVITNSAHNYIVIRNTEPVEYIYVPNTGAKMSQKSFKV